MRAIVYHTYGSPDVLELQEVATPVPKAHEILIHVHAAAVTPADIAFRKGEPFLGRVFTHVMRNELKSKEAERNECRAGPPERKQRTCQDTQAQSSNLFSTSR